MNRLYRLLSPGIIFGILGLAVFVYGKWSWFQLRGGLVTVGLYALALQIVLSALAISAIDDLSGRSLWHRVGGTGKLRKISARPTSFPRALAEFYLRPFLPAFLLGFGLAASISAFAAGVFHQTSHANDFVYVFAGIYPQRSEALLAVILVLGAAFLWWRGGVSYFGWVIGVCLATVVGQLVFVGGTIIYTTVVSWGGLMIGLCLLRLLVLATTLVWRTRFSSRPATR